MFVQQNHAGVAAAAQVVQCLLPARGRNADEPILVECLDETVAGRLLIMDKEDLVSHGDTRAARSTTSAPAFESPENRRVFEDSAGFVQLKSGRSLRTRNSYAVGITPDEICYERTSTGKMTGVSCSRRIGAQEDAGVEGARDARHAAAGVSVSGDGSMIPASPSTERRAL